MGRSRGPEGYLRPVKVTRPPVAANPNVSSRLHRVRPPELFGLKAGSAFRDVWEDLQMRGDKSAALYFGFRCCDG
jgi:hypothetical protein